MSCRVDDPKRKRHELIGLGLPEVPQEHDSQAATYEHVKHLNEKMEAEEMEQDYPTESSDEEMPKIKKREEKKYNCQECDYAASKPALLIQHLRSHSEQKPFSCPVSGCPSTYKRQDHLNRHMKIHDGARFSCTIPGCDRSFSMMTNLTRHLKYHAEKSIFPKPKSSGEKKHKCLNPGCEKIFRYQSELRSHEDNVHSIVFAEHVCIYPGCGEKLTSEAALLKHAVEAHPYLLCEVCGETITRQAYRRHVRSHGTKKPVKVTCPYEGCTHHYTRESNLRSHIRSFHLKLKPFVCSFEGCDKSFAHKAARKRHEMSVVHCHTGTDFEAAELAESSKSKGGRKKVCFEKVEDLYIRRAKKVSSSRAKGQHHHIDSQGEEEMKIGTL